MYFLYINLRSKRRQNNKNTKATEELSAFCLIQQALSLNPRKLAHPTSKYIILPTCFGCQIKLDETEWRGCSISFVKCMLYKGSAVNLNEIRVCQTKDLIFFYFFFFNKRQLSAFRTHSQISFQQLYLSAY